MSQKVLDNPTKPTQQFTTSCEHCVFADWEYILSRDAPHFKQQIGCKLNRLKKFKNTEVLEGKIDEKGYLAEKYYKIDGYCTACRQKDWIKQDDIVEQIYRELDEKTIIDVLVGINDKSEMEDVNNLIDNLKSCTKKPSTIHFLLFENHDKFSPTTFISHVNDLLKSTPIKWRTEYIMEKEDPEFIISRSFQKIKSMFTVITQPDSKIPQDLFTRLSNWINKDLKSISLLQTSDFCIVQTLLYRALSKANPHDVIDQIKSIAKEHSQEDMVIEYES